MTNQPTSNPTDLAAAAAPIADFNSLTELLVNAIRAIETLGDDRGSVLGIPTGFSDLDKLTSGLGSGDLIVLASRPSIGKSTLALNIAEHVAILLALPVAVFSMEISDSKVTTNIISSQSRIKTDHLMTGKLTVEEWPHLVNALERLQEVSMAIDDTPNQTLINLRAKALRQKELCADLGLVVVDSLQMMHGDPNINVQGLKILAQELGCPIILTAHIGDGVEFRPDKRPTMYDIRDVPAIERTADTIMFLFRDDFYTKGACREPGVAEVNVIKQRTGPTGVVKLAFMMGISRFESLTGLY